MQKKYAVDTARLHAFLAEQGMSARNIQALRITFRSIPLPKVFGWSFYGCYNILRHSITIFTHGFTVKEINETLMHELQHAIDYKLLKIMFALRVVTVIACILLSRYVFSLFIGVLIQGILNIIMPLAVLELMYRFDPMERRARAFQKKHRDYMVVRLEG